MAEQAMARLDGTRPAPLISFVSDFDSLAERVSRLEQTGTIVPPGMLARLMADRDVLLEQAIQDAATRRIGLSDRRLFTGKLRRKVQLRDRVCTWPGCHQPAVRCDIDHRIEYCEGGPTTEDNGQALCSRHNRLKERIRKLMARRRRRQELGRPPPPPPLRRSTGRAGPDRRSPAGPPDPGVP